MLNENTANHINVSYKLIKKQNITLGIIHIGLGAFHRAHQALITDEFMNMSGQRNWGIISANIIGGEQLVKDMQLQNNLFTVTETDDGGKRKQKLISSIVHTVYAENDRESLIKLMCMENIRIVSMTITEKGYCTNFTNGHLHLNHPLIEHDIKNPKNPKSIIGLIVAALSKRRTAGIKAFTVMSCDNIPNNGNYIKNSVLQFASLINTDLAN